MSKVLECVNINDKNKEADVSYQPSCHDEKQSFKEIIFQSDCEEDFVEGKLLTSLVRESYLRRLREIVHKNYETWLESENIRSAANAVDNKLKINITIVDIENCVKFLEQKALRTCMMAALYQKAMVNLMNAIKQSTKKTELCDSLNKTERISRTESKLVQTENDLLVEKECQTTETVNKKNTLNTSNKTVSSTRSTSSLLDLPLPDPKDVLKSLSSNLNSPKTNHVNPLRETVAKILPQPRTIVNEKSKSSCSLSNSNKLRDEGFSRETKRRKLSEDTYVNNLLSIVPNDNSTREVINNMDLLEMLTDNYDDPMFNNFNTDSNSVEDNVFGLSQISEQPVVCTENVILNQSNENYEVSGKKCSKSLDDRLAELGIFSNDESINSTTYQTTSLPKGPRRTWAMEMSAQYCNFAKMYLSLENSVRETVNHKFVELFGPSEEDHNVVLTPELLSVSRKRTANIVVAELTPFYSARRITSRYLFKEFAKRLTDSILKRTYICDSTTINQFVCDYFGDNTVINSVDDFNF